MRLRVSVAKELFQFWKGLQEKKKGWFLVDLEDIDALDWSLVKGAAKKSS